VALVAGKVVVLSPLWLVPPAVATATLEHVNAGYAHSAATTKIGAGKDVRGTEAIKWTRPSEGERERGVLVTVEVPGTPKQVSWHRKGDYFATVAVEGEWLLFFSVDILQPGPLHLAMYDPAHSATLTPRSRQQVRSHPPTVQACHPITLPQNPRDRPASRVPPSQAVVLCRHAALRQAVRPR
jgi:hypothetical protein